MCKILSLLSFIKGVVNQVLNIWLKCSQYNDFADSLAKTCKMCVSYEVAMLPRSIYLDKFPHKHWQNL